MTTTRTTPKVGLSIYEVLVLIMRDVTHVGKEQYNKSQKYSFRGIDDMVMALGPKLREYGVVHYPTVVDSWRRDTETGKGTLMRETILRVRYTFIGPAGDRIDDLITEGESLDTGDKGTAKAHSVAWRVALIQLFALPTDEPDPDSDYYEDRGRERDDRHDRHGEQRRPSRRADRVNDDDRGGDDQGDRGGDDRDDRDDDDIREARELELKTLKRKARELELDRDEVAERYKMIFGGEELTEGAPDNINRFCEFIVQFGQLPAAVEPTEQHPDVPRLLREGGDPAQARANVRKIRDETAERLAADQAGIDRDNIEGR
jgi:hypothetical protein